METLAITALGSGVVGAAGPMIPTAGLFGFGGSFGLMQTISTVGTGFSLASTIMGGQAQNAASESAARYEEFRAQQERTRGRLEAAKIKEDLAKALSTSIAVGAAQGIDISSGSPANARNAAITDANEAWSMARINADMNAGANEQNAYQMRARGSNAVRSSRSRAVGIASDFLQKQYDRGMTF